MSLFRYLSSIAAAAALSSRAFICKTANSSLDELTVN